MFQDMTFTALASLETEAQRDGLAGLSLTAGKGRVRLYLAGWSGGMICLLQSADIIPCGDSLGVQGSFEVFANEHTSPEMDVLRKHEGHHGRFPPPQRRHIDFSLGYDIVVDGSMVRFSWAS